MNLSIKHILFPVLTAALVVSMAACNSATPVASTPVPATVAPAETGAPASANPVDTPASVGPAGASFQNPAARTETVSTANWEFTVVEVVRGEEAAAQLKSASAFNKPNPDPALEYLLVKVHAKYVGTDSDTHHIDSSFFTGTDSTGTRYDRVKNTDVKASSPSMSSFDDLTSGGEVEGWAVIQARKGDPAVLLVIWPRENGLILGEETIRYISLE